MKTARVIQRMWYSWTCPICGSNNEENGECVNKIVKCDDCERLSEVEIVHTSFDEG